MKKLTLKKRLIGMLLAVMIAFSASVATIVPASAAAAANVSFSDVEPDGSVIPEAGYAAALALIRMYVPGGGVITSVLDTIVNAFRDHGPTLDDISAEITRMRNEINTQFNDIKNQMKIYTEEIENKIVDQTVIAAKGAGFDRLMTALAATGRQIQAISTDRTLNENEKAVEIAALIGKSSKWIESNNLYFEYQDFVNTLASSSFADQKDRDLYQVVYSDFISKSMFSGEALDFSRPYIERVMLLGLYAYSINAQCLKAAQTVSMFTAEDIATLNEDELNQYRNVKSLTSVVNAEIRDMHERMFQMEMKDSVVSHLKLYHEMNRLVFLRNGTAYRPMSKGMRLANFSTVADVAAYNDIVNLMNAGALSCAEFADLAAHVKATYPGKSLRSFLSDMGFEMSNVPQNTLIAVGGVNAYKSEGFFYRGGAAIRYYYNFPSVSVDDVTVSTVSRDCFKRVFVGSAGNFVEVSSSADVMNFRNA